MISIAYQIVAAQEDGKNSEVALGLHDGFEPQNAVDATRLCPPKACAPGDAPDKHGLCHVGAVLYDVANARLAAAGQTPRKGTLLQQQTSPAALLPPDTAMATLTLTLTLSLAAMPTGQSGLLASGYSCWH